MSVIPFREFKGEIPRLPADALPDGYAQTAINVDLQHGEIRGLRGDAPFTQTALGAACRAVYTDDGTNFFAWPYETYPVKSMVVGDLYHRLYYTTLLPDGPLIKVARTRRSFTGQVDGVAVAGSPLVGGNFKPPENTGPGQDSWVLGVPAPRVQGVADTDELVATLTDKAEWPGAPHLQLRVTYFLEDAAGNIVYQQSINNTEAAIHPVTGVSYPQVFSTNDWRQRGNKIQDMLWPLGNIPRPYKYYWYQPPTGDDIALSRTVTVVNDGTGDIVITYSGSTPVSGGTSDGAYTYPIAALGTTGQHLDDKLYLYAMQDPYRITLASAGLPGGHQLFPDLLTDASGRTLWELTGAAYDALHYQENLIVNEIGVDHIVEALAFDTDAYSGPCKGPVTNLIARKLAALGTGGGGGDGGTGSSPGITPTGGNDA